MNTQGLLMASGLMLTALGFIWRSDTGLNLFIKVSVGILGILDIVQAVRM